MKQHFERYGIYYLIGLIFLIGIVVLVAAYIPAVGTEISENNADWGNFGAFFWGFGTMCFSLLNVWLFYSINKKLYLRSFLDIYRHSLEKVLETIKPDDINARDVRVAIADMIGVLGSINNVKFFSTDVTNEAAQLAREIAQKLDAARKPSNKTIIDIAGNLTAFQICLITNRVTKKVPETNKETNKE